MTIEQLSGSIMVLAFVLAVANVLVGGVRLNALLPLRRRSRPHRAGDCGATLPARADDERRAPSRRPALRDLSDAERARYTKRWGQLQRRADALPATTLLDADDLLARMLDDIGYPTEGFVQCASELAPAHAEVIDDYRAARNVVLDARLGLADTAQIRHALSRYAVVFACLAGPDISTRAEHAAA